MKKLIAEFLGTFFLMFVIILSGDPLAIGIILAIMVFAFGYISGGLFNPAATIAMVVNKELTIPEGFQYIASQFLGAFVASILALIILDKHFIVSVPESTAFVDAMLIEILFTFALVTVIFNTAVNTKNTPNHYFGLAIGLTIFVAATAGGPISGGAFNPAVGISPLFTNFQGLGQNLLNNLIYIAGPVIGAVLAAFLNKILSK